MPGGDLPGPGISALTSAAPRESSTAGVTVIPTDSPAPLGRERLPERFRGPLQQPQPLNVLLPGREGRDRGGGGWMGAGPRKAGALNSSRSDLQQWSGRCTAAFPGLDIGEPLGQPVLAAEPGSPLRVGQVDPEFWKAGWRETRDNSLGQRWKGSRRLTTDAVGDHDDRHQPLAWKGWAARVGGFPPTAMSTGNDTGWGSSVGEEAWAGTGVEVEESALPTFSTAAKVRVGVTAALFLSSAAGNLAVLWSVTRPRSSRLRPSPVRRLFGHLAAADLLVTFVVMPLDAAWNATVQWLAGDVACRILMFLKLLAMYAAAFLPVVIGLDRQAAVLHPLGPRGGGRKLLGTAWGLSFLLALPQLFLFHTVRRAGPVPFIQCVTKGSFKARWQEIAYNLFTFCGLFLIPLIAMAICYGRIVFSVSRHRTGKREHAPAGQFDLRRSFDNRPRVRLRALRLSLLVLLTFVICWTPYYLLGLWYWFSPSMLSNVPPSLSHILFLFGLLNAPLDPLLYGAFTLGCRKGHQELVIDSSRGQRSSWRVPQKAVQAPRQLEVSTEVSGKTGKMEETSL